MPTPSDIDIRHVLNLPPERAIEYFRSKGFAIGFNATDIAAGAHAKAFTVAGVMQHDVLSMIRNELDKALANGTSFQEFKNNIVPMLKARGYYGSGQIVDPKTGEITGKRLTPARLDLIFRNNMQSAYQAGRYAEQMANIDHRPYVEYVGILDNRIRPAHKALSGRVFRLDDPVMSIIWPPNGHRCRCTTRTWSETDIKRRNIDVSSSKGRLVPVNQVINAKGDTRPAIGYADPATGKLFLPDAGFGYNPGQAWARPFTPAPSNNLPQTRVPGDPLPRLPKSPPGPLPPPTPPGPTPPAPPGPTPPAPPGPTPPAPPGPTPPTPPGPVPPAPPGPTPPAPPGPTPPAQPGPVPPAPPAATPPVRPRSARQIGPSVPGVPAQPVPAAPPAPTPEAAIVRQQFLSRLGAGNGPVVHVDPVGHHLPISAALFDMHALRSEARLPWLAETLAAPDEIWLYWGRDASGQLVLRRRYVKGFASRQGELEQDGLGVLDWGKDGWGGSVNFAPYDMTPEALRYWQDAHRSGFLLWARSHD